MRTTIFRRLEEFTERFHPDRVRPLDEDQKLGKLPLGFQDHMILAFELRLNGTDGFNDLLKAGYVISGLSGGTKLSDIVTMIDENKRFDAARYREVRRESFAQGIAGLIGSLTRQPQPPVDSPKSISDLLGDVPVVHLRDAVTARFLKYLLSPTTCDDYESAIGGAAELLAERACLDG